MPPPAVTVLLEVAGVSVRFPVGRGRFVQAVDGVSLTVQAGEAVGLVGESGCGKSTLARLVNRLLEPDAGQIRLEGEDIGAIPVRAFAAHPARAAIQMVFQDAADSLDPRLTAARSIGLPVRRLLRLGERAAAARVRQAAELVGLAPELLGRYPHQLSGGQQARVGIARAIAPGPRVLVLDEPTSALDVSVQATVLRLFADLQARLGVALLFISHDLNVVRLLCDRILVMYRGEVVESGPAATVFAAPLHPYTAALVDAVPDPARRGRPAPPDTDAAAGQSGGCRYAALCPRAAPRCRAERPALRALGGGRVAACHLV